MKKRNYAYAVGYLTLLSVAFGSGIWIGETTKTVSGNHGAAVTPTPYTPPRREDIHASKNTHAVRTAPAQRQTVVHRSKTVDSRVQIINKAIGNAVFGHHPPGAWGISRNHLRTLEISEKSRERIQRILSVGYMAGAEPAPRTEGVITNDPKYVSPGLNFVVSGDRAGAVLMDANGKTLHSWECPIKRALPKANPNAAAWSRALLFPNGEVIGVYEGVGLVALDKDSHVLWAKSGFYHHDITEGDDGLLYVLVREKHSYPNCFHGASILEDYVVVLDRAGHELRKVSVLKGMMASPYYHLLPESVPHEIGPADVFHTNSVQRIPKKFCGTAPFLGKNLVLVSIHQLSTVAVLDLDSGSVIWACTGMWSYQHCARLLNTGNLLVFDNFASDSTSEVIEINPLTQEVLWRFTGSKKFPFFSSICGYNQRLENGNTLIVESEQGRAFEVTKGGRVVWQYINPHRAGDKGQYIAFLFQVQRINPKQLDPSFARDLRPSASSN